MIKVYNLPHHYTRSDFKNGRTYVHDEEKSGRPSIVTDEMFAKVDEKIRENRRFTITELSLSFPQVSRILLFENVTQKLGYRKFCARWVSKLLTDHHKGQRMGAALRILDAYDKHDDSLLDRIVTGDETWVRHVNCETKLQSMKWGHTSSLKRQRKCLQTLSPKQMMATVFWDRQSALLIDFLERGATIKSERYYQTLCKLTRAVQNNRRGKLASKILFLHDNARPHTANCTQELLNSFKWEVFP
ncbi:histone-lysine N-methyltransferase SETMAR [Trichonephila clavipes]|nr:histone-lysine N-methyltransferase SETMAR [Trichonephila clavipes]